MATAAQATKTVYPPRPYQNKAITKTRAKMAKGEGALCIMPTGAGKTLVMGNTADQEIGDMPEAKILVLQHTKELLKQNLEAISSVVAHRGTTVSMVKAGVTDWDGQIVFASTPKLSCAERRAEMPAFTHVLVDECHRLGTPTVKKIIAELREANPDIRIGAYTATPNRSDKERLTYAVGETPAYQITYSELIDLGVLVTPRTYVRDLGINAEIEAMKLKGGDYDLDKISFLYAKSSHNDAIYEHWLKRAKGRKTIGFCTTVNHARMMAAAFQAKGIKAEAVYGTMKAKDRDSILERYENGDVQVVFNCNVLIEGYDAPRTSCIILLRPMRHELTFIQAVGRGLRTVDQEKYPQDKKKNCVILDFTPNSQRHRTLEVRLETERFEAAQRAEAEAAAIAESHKLIEPMRQLRHFDMTEIDLLASADLPLFEGSAVCPHVISNNNFAWAGIFYHNENFHVLARSQRQPVEHLATGSLTAMAAVVNEFLLEDDSGRIPRNIREAQMTEELEIAIVMQGINPDEVANFYEAKCRLSVAQAASQIKALLGIGGAVIPFPAPALNGPATMVEAIAA